MLKSIYEKCLVVGILLVMASCARLLIMSEISPGDGINKEFLPLVYSFDGLGEMYIKGYCQPEIDIGFGNLKNMDQDKDEGTTTIGVCIPTRRPMILFDRNYWESATPTERQMLAYHEMGHCILDLEHDESMMDVDGHKQPASLMNPIIFNEHQYLKMQKYYVEQLFGASKKTEKEWNKECTHVKN